MFSSLKVSDWRQYSEVDLRFHDRLTVLTGANGSGKTTLLNILSQHVGWNTQFLSTPVTRRGALSWLSGLRGSRRSEESLNVIGELEYSSGATAQLHVPDAVSQQYNVKIRGQQAVSGIFLPSHRPVYSYGKVDAIPMEMDAREQLLEGYLANLKGMWAASARVDSPTKRLKQSLISLAVFGYGNEVVESNEEALETFLGFQNVLRSVLPAGLGFQRLSIRRPEVVFECESGEFSLDAASGGVSALIDVAWQIYLRSVLSPDAFVVLADEPENHLHPELQRSLLPGLIEAFPAAQFIVATHNPFVIGSVPDSNVYVLDYADSEGDVRRVSSELLDLVNKAGTSNEILRDVLGVPMPTSIWVEEELSRIAAQLDRPDISREVLESARQELRQLGLEKYLPAVLPGNDR